VPVIAITGGLGSGKSTVREIFEELGAKGLDTDAISRQVVESGTPGAEKIREMFGDSFFTPEGDLNRKMMAAHVFSNSDERQKLESILHPFIREAEGDMVKKFLHADTDTVVVVEIPLLAEGGRSAQYDGVVLVTAPMGVRLERLVKSGRYTREEAASRMANQADDAKREQIASWTVENAGTIDETRAQVLSILRPLLP